MGHLNGKVIISPCLLTERGDQGKRGQPATGRKRLQSQTGTAHVYTPAVHKHLHHAHIPKHTLSYTDTPDVLLTPNKGTSMLANLPAHSSEDTHTFTTFTVVPVFCPHSLSQCLSV